MKKTYVLNKPALLTSEEALLRFDGHDIVIPIAVLADLRSSKKSLRGARRAIAEKLFDKLESFDLNTLKNEGVLLENGTRLRISFNYNDIQIKLAAPEDISSKDKRIIKTCLGLKNEGKNVILISNDFIVRSVARDNEIIAEELKDRVFPSVKDQYKGYADVFASQSTICELYNKGWIDVTDIYDYDKIDWQTNMYLCIKGENNASALASFDGNKIVQIKEYKNPYGIKPKNVRQKFMLNALMDPDIPLVIIKGNAGTGKTFCSLAAALQQSTEDKLYDQILITKSTDTVDQEELGFLPGDKNEKMDPFIKGVYDNLEKLYKPVALKKEEEKEIDLKKLNSTIHYLFDSGIFEIQTIGHIRGRSIENRYFIIDETQNTAPEAIKQIATRAGENSKFVFLGDPSQIDAPDLNEKYNGLVYLSEMMKGKELCRQITMNKLEDTVRSPLAQLAVDVLI